MSHWYSKQWKKQKQFRCFVHCVCSLLWDAMNGHDEAHQWFIYALLCSAIVSLFFIGLSAILGYYKWSLCSRMWTVRTKGLHNNKVYTAPIFSAFCWNTSKLSSKHYTTLACVYTRLHLILGFWGHFVLITCTRMIVTLIVCFCCSSFEIPQSYTLWILAHSGNMHQGTLTQNGQCICCGCKWATITTLHITQF